MSTDVIRTFMFGEERTFNQNVLWGGGGRESSPLYAASATIYAPSLTSLLVEPWLPESHPSTLINSESSSSVKRTSLVSISRTDSVSRQTPSHASPATVSALSHAPALTSSIHCCICRRSTSRRIPAARSWPLSSSTTLFSSCGCCVEHRYSLWSLLPGLRTDRN